MRTMGFGREDFREQAQSVIPQTDAPKAAVRSLVRVRFEDSDRELTYFNDAFDLKDGDRVFVSGKLAGKAGIVTSVTTKFRIRLSDYERVIALAQTPIRGTYRPVADKMLSYDDCALSPEAFRTWILPPEEPADGPCGEEIYGEGYEIPLDDPSDADGVDDAVFERAVEYSFSGKVGYVSVKNGVGRAFVRGREWYELEFRLRDNVVEEAYCSCPYPGLCKHLLATACLLSLFIGAGDLDPSRDFVLVEAGRFFDMIRHNDQAVTL